MDERRIILKKRLMLLSVPFFVFLFSARAFAQQGVKFIYPLDVPMSLSGNYGELRGNHFHGGIDFRVGGVVGAPIKATADGYVSKITVSPSGYGNALYITHSNGYVSVHGHLHRFADHIQKFVRGYQYEKESFSVTIELGPDKFPVKQGQIVAYAGNTGSSGGPHLHFEIRDEENLPLDVLDRNFIKATDKLPPVINRVEFFGYSDICGVPKCEKITRPKEGTIKVPQCFYVAVDAVDKMEGTAAKLAVNEYKVYLDGAIKFELVVGEVPFGEGRYINSLIEYSLKSRTGKSFIKTYVEPGNMLEYKLWYENDGILVLNDTLAHKVKIVVSDYKGNTSSRSYVVKRDDSVMPADTCAASDGAYMAWYLANVYEKEGLKVTLPAASLYRSIYFNADTLPRKAGAFSPVWKIHTPETPLHTPGIVSMRYDGPQELADKALLAVVRKDGTLSGAGGGVEDGVLVAKLHSFGTYTAAIDTVAPSVTPSFNNGAVLKGNKVSFVIKDRLSGLKDYRVEIDGHWVLAEFDAKNARLNVPLTDAKIKRGVMHSLKIVVEDNKGNKKVLNRKFKW